MLIHSDEHDHPIKIDARVIRRQYDNPNSEKKCVYVKVICTQDVENDGQMYENTSS